jgi:DNA-binding MarR family transcriptional regulator/N-acetylglutamate synthase-like GNAT family acetyltransferase
MDGTVASLRSFNRFYTRFVGALDAHYLNSDLSLVEARLLYEVATRERPLASEIQAELGLDAGYISRLLRRFQSRGWISRGRGDDGRQRPIALTSEGRSAFAALDERSRGEIVQRLEAIGPTDRATLVQALATVKSLLSGKEAPWTMRTFRSGDLPLIASRQAVLYAEGFDWGRPMEVLLGEVTTAFLRDFKPGREQCWVAERAGSLAGSVMLVDAGEGVGQLRLLHVEPWARGLGIGGALVAECVRFAREAGYSKVRLWTHSVLGSARRIYQAQGFRIVSSEVHHEFGRPEQGETWELALEG